MRKNTFNKEVLLQGVDVVEECWIWNKTKPATTTGYSQLSINGVTYLLHRLVFELYHRPLQDGECVLHTCDNRPCCNPDHLVAGTKSDNNRDRAEKGRSCSGEDSHLSKLTEDVVLQIFNEPGSYRGLARKYGLNKGTIKQIKTKQTWRHLWK